MEKPLLTIQQGAFRVCVAADGGKSAGAQLPAGREKSEGSEKERQTCGRGRKITPSGAAGR